MDYCEQLSIETSNTWKKFPEHASLSQIGYFGERNVCVIVSRCQLAGRVTIVIMVVKETNGVISILFRANWLEVLYL